MNLHEGSFLQGGRYRIEKVLGQGGFGITYSGIQTNLEAKVAIKEFFMKDLCNRDTATSQVTVGSVGSRETVERFRQKFIKEARNIFRLKHKHIIPVIDVFEENGTAYYVMEHVGGGSLSDKVRHGALPEAAAVRYTRQVAEALAFVHSKRIMHLDVKPANILLDDNDNAVLIDFGLAKQYDDEGHQTSSTPVGISHGYAPLEQYKRGGVSTFSPATDIYSLGATLFKLVTGITPPEASDVNDDGLPVLPQEISAPVRRAIEAAMEPKRKDRPQSIEEFLALLNGFKDLKDPKDSKDLNEATKAPNEDLIDDVDVEVTVLPERAKKKDERGKIKEQSEAIKEQHNANKEQSEETRAVEKKTEQPTIKNNEPVASKKNHVALVVAVVLLGVLVGSGLFFAFSGNDGGNDNNSSRGNDRLATHNEEPATTVVIEDTEDETSTVPSTPVVNTDSSTSRTFTVDGVEFKMIAVKGGTFQMGATGEQQNPDSDESPFHVTLSDYYIAETEVTQELWQAVMGSNPSYFTGNIQRPVESVSWNDCQTFISRLNAKTGMSFRLPTEAEWEYAARGGNRSNKTQYSGNSNIDNVAWYGSNSGSTTHPVKSKSPNELGLYDMSGNVYEWCFDSYDTYSSSAQTNPKVDNGPGSIRVLRGGSWNSGAQGCRVAYRYGRYPSYSFNYRGLRLAL